MARPKSNAPRIVASVVSLWHVAFHCPRMYRDYDIPARPDNGLKITDKEFADTFGILKIGEATGSMDIGEKRRMPQPVDAYAIADDLVETDGLRQYGVFVPDGDTPTREDLQVARALLVRKAQSLVREGDTKWSRLETRREISDLNRWAVLQLDESREWVYEYVAPPVKGEALPICKFCNVELKTPDPALCWNCKMILNEAKAKKLGLELETAGAKK